MVSSKYKVVMKTCFILDPEKSFVILFVHGYSVSMCLPCPIIISVIASGMTRRKYFIIIEKYKKSCYVRGKRNQSYELLLALECSARVVAFKPMFQALEILPTMWSNYVVDYAPDKCEMHMQQEILILAVCSSCCWIKIKCYDGRSLWLYIRFSGFSIQIQNKVWFEE